MNRVYFLMLMCFFFQKKSYAQKDEKSFKFSNDTLWNKNDMKTNFFSIKNISISNFYEIKDSISLNINNDSVADLVVVLSPKKQSVLNPLDCDDKYCKRLLVVLISDKKKYKVGLISQQAIPNANDYMQDAFIKLEKRIDGFSIELFAGSVIRCNYDFYFKIYKNSFYLYKTSYDCYKIDLSKTKQKKMVSQLGKISLKSFDVNKMFVFPNLE